MINFTAEQKKIIALSSLGGALEFYDFIVFVFLAKVLSQLFFPTTDTTASLMATFTLFAVGYFMRPLGGIVFGHFGDRLGRKKTFIATIILMTVPTFFIGLLPTYQTAGIVAPILLVILRLLQGFSVGGEIPGAIVFVTETAPSARRGLACALVLFGLNLGLLFGSCIVALITHYLTREQLLTWGWRIPFYLGGILGMVSFYLRKRLQETPIFQALTQTKKFTLPIKDVLKNYPKQIGQGSALTILGASLVSLLFLFMPTYLATYFNYPLEKVMLLNTITLAIFSIQVIVIGYLSDKVGYMKLMRIGMLGIILLSYPLYQLFALHNFTLVIISTIILSILSGLITSCFLNVLVTLFATRVRYTGVAFAYNLGFAVAGSLMPLIATAMIHWTGNVLIPSYCLIVIAIIAFIVSFSISEKHTTKKIINETLAF